MTGGIPVNIKLLTQNKSFRIKCAIVVFVILAAAVTGVKAADLLLNLI